MISIDSLFDGRVSYAFAWTMIHSLWQFALIAAILAISMRLTRHRSANLRYLQGMVGLCICIIVSVLTFTEYYSAVSRAEALIDAASTGVALIYSGNLWEQAYTALNARLDYILAIWFLGFALQFYRYSNSFVRALMLKNHACEAVAPDWQHRLDNLVHEMEISRRIAFKQSQLVTSCCVIGHLKPVVLLPLGMLTSLTVEQVEAVLLHEFAHIKRNDYLVNALQCFVRVVFFFNPALHWISNRIDIERENACDDMAVERGASPKTFASSLVQLSELNLKVDSVLAANKNTHQTLLRIKRLFIDSSHISRGTERLASAVCAGLMVAALNVSAAQLDSMQAASLLDTPAPAQKNQDAATENPAESMDASQPVSAPVAKTREPVAEARPPAPEVSSPVADENLPVAEVEPAADIPPAMNATPELDYVVQQEASEPPEPSQVEKQSSPEPVQLASAASSTNSLAISSPAMSPPAESAPVTPTMEALATPHFDKFLIASSIKSPATRKILIEEVTSAFADAWLERFRGDTRESYRKEILNEYGKSLANELKTAFAQAGWQLVDEPGEDVLRITPRLFDIYIVGPETNGAPQTLVSQAGRGAVELVFTTPAGQSFMKITDYRNTLNSSSYLVTRASNYHYFRMLFSQWASDSERYLDNVMHIIEQAAAKG